VFEPIGVGTRRRVHLLQSAITLHFAAVDSFMLEVILVVGYFVPRGSSHDNLLL